MADAPGTGSKHSLRKSAIACSLLLAIAGGGVLVFWDVIAVWLCPQNKPQRRRSEAA